jgi:hypothetical protein
MIKLWDSFYKCIKCLVRENTGILFSSWVYYFLLQAKNIIESFYMTLVIIIIPIQRGLQNTFQLSKNFPISSSAFWAHRIS